MFCSVRVRVPRAPTADRTSGKMVHFTRHLMKVFCFLGLSVHFRRRPVVSPVSSISLIIAQRNRKSILFLLHGGPEQFCFDLGAVWGFQVLGLADTVLQRSLISTGYGVFLCRFFDNYGPGRIWRHSAMHRNEIPGGWFW